MTDFVIAELDHFVREGSIVEKLSPVLEQLSRKLEDNPTSPQAWKALPWDFFGKPLPSGIASCWAFALRGGGIFENERHPNSWQRSIGIRGTANFEVYAENEWRARPVIASSPAVENRTVSIPPNVWHRIAIGEETFVSLSFHTAAAAELIEETCEEGDFTRTKRRLYQG